jgi:hypothetical protein
MVIVFCGVTAARLAAEPTAVPAVVLCGAVFALGVEAPHPADSTTTVAATSSVRRGLTAVILP